MGKIIDKIFGIKDMGRCAYCGEYTEIKEYYGGYGGAGKMLGSPCCFKCDEANMIKWNKKSIEKDIEDRTKSPSKEQKIWIKKRNKLLSH